MADALPDTGRLAYELVRFVQAMHEAAVGPEGPWVQRAVTAAGLSVGMVRHSDLSGPR